MESLVYKTVYRIHLNHTLLRFKRATTFEGCEAVYVGVRENSHGRYNQVFITRPSKIKPAVFIVSGYSFLNNQPNTLYISWLKRRKVGYLEGELAKQILSEVGL